MRANRITASDCLYLSVVAALAVGVALFLANISGQWMFTFIGDEWAVYDRASLVVAGKNGLAREMFGPLSEGVYRVHQPFLTFCQAVVMMVLGDGHFGWRMSSILAFALSIPSLFVLVSLISSRRVALLASGFMALSYYLLAEALWGYGWTFLRLFTIWHALALMLFLTKPSFFRGVALGLTATLSTLSGALCSYLSPLTFVILAIFAFMRRGRSSHPYVAAFFVSYFLTCTLPSRLLARPDGLQKTLILTLRKTSLGPILQKHFGKEMFPNVEGSADTAPELLRVIFERFIDTITAPLTFVGESHYLFGTLTYPIVGVLSLIGLVGVSIAAMRHWVWRITLLFYLPAVFLAGALSPYAQPAITRTHFLVPFWCVFAALALDYIFRRCPRWSFSVVAILLLALNGAWAYRKMVLELPYGARFSPSAYAMQILFSFPERRVAFVHGKWTPLKPLARNYGLNERALIFAETDDEAIIAALPKDPLLLVVLPPTAQSKVARLKSALCSNADLTKVDGLGSDGLNPSCDCRECGGYYKRPFVICGSFECPIALPAMGAMKLP